jgi:hypothetical protein
MGITSRGAAGVAGVLLALGLAGQASASPPAQHFTYVAATAGYSGVIDLAAEHDTPVGHTSPQGTISFVPPDGRFSLAVDDATVLDGQTVPVLIYQRATDGDLVMVRRCVPDDVATTFTGWRKGVLVGVDVLSDAASFDGLESVSRCSGHATAGTATLIVL